MQTIAAAIPQNICPLVFAVVAATFSLFFGFKASQIFGADHAGQTRSWKFQQFWLNFTGSVTGWLILWVAIRRVSIVIGSAQAFKMSDFILFLVAFIGINGFLPLSVVSFIQGIRDIAGRVMGAVRQRDQ